MRILRRMFEILLLPISWLMPIRSPTATAPIPGLSSREWCPLGLSSCKESCLSKACAASSITEGQPLSKRNGLNWKKLVSELYPKHQENAPTKCLNAWLSTAKEYRSFPKGNKFWCGLSRMWIIRSHNRCAAKVNHCWSFGCFSTEWLL